MNSSRPLQWLTRYRAGALSGILILGLLQQGCFAAAWLAAVGADSMRTSHVTFEQFEASWVSSEKPAEIAQSSSLSSVTVLPVEGDAEMGQRLIQILREHTALNIETTAKLARVPFMPHHDQAACLVIAQQVSRELAVDAVLFGHVTWSVSQASDWEWKEREHRRLFLYLVDRDGHLLWKDELPFIVVTGSKPPLEGSVQASLAQHLMDHVRDLGLDALGYLPQKTS